MPYPKPLLKWVGGKTQIINQLVQCFPSTIENYYEPFLGGGSVLIAFMSLVHDGKIHVNGHIFASDVNERLIHLYKNVQSRPLELLNCVEDIQALYDKCPATATNPATAAANPNRKPHTLAEAQTSQEAMFYWIRQQYNELPLDMLGSPNAAAMLMFLNKTCFRGLYREGPYGFNVAFGNYKDPQIADRQHILHLSVLIQRVKFSCCSFDTALTSVASGDFVYMDPPYAPENDKSFVKYNKHGFDLNTHKQLFTMCHAMGRKNIDFIMCNAEVELVRNAFKTDPYEYTPISCKRTINSKKPDSVANEVIIRSGSGIQKAHLNSIKTSLNEFEIALQEMGPINTGGGTAD